MKLQNDETFEKSYADNFIFSIGISSRVTYS